MSYSKTVWEDLPSTNTPLSAANLNKIENELEQLADTNIITAYLSQDQSIPSGGVSRINIDSVFMSVGNKLTLSQNPSEIVCGKSGHLKISAFVTLSDLVANGNTQIRIFINDSVYMLLATRAANTLDQGFSITPKLFNVSQGDKIAISIGNWTGSANVVKGSASYNYITVEYVD